MKLSAREKAQRGTWLLAAHLASLDPSTVSVRERLDAQIGRELARKLVRAFVARGRVRRVV